MIPKGLVPIASAASTTPGSTSSKAISICRAKKGMIPAIKGTNAAVSPMVVPTRNRVKVPSNVNKIIKGIERTTLMTLSRNSKSGRFSKIPFGRVTTKTIPNKIPKMPAIKEVQKTIYKVWIVAVTNSSWIATTLGKYLSNKAAI